LHPACLATIDAMRERVRAEPGWRMVELATGNDAMIGTPQRCSRCYSNGGDPAVVS
jgi:hypothetical protein